MPHQPYHVDLVGHTFGSFSVLTFAGKNPARKTLWRCQCKCGAIRVYPSDKLKHRRSCGCTRPPNHLDLTGREFGRLRAVRFVGRDPTRKALWLCECACGHVAAYRSDKLTGGRTVSCGCKPPHVRVTHGQWGTPIYQAWRNVITAATYRPIISRRVCPAWTTFAGFEKDMRPTYRPGLCLLRRVKGDWTPENCYWAPTSQRRKFPRSTAS